MSQSYWRLKASLKKEAALYYHQIGNLLQTSWDDTFALPGDVPLTEEEIKAIDDFWGRYHFAYPNIDYKSFQTFKNRCGHFDPHHFPGRIKTYTLKLIDEHYSAPFQNKAMLGMLYPDIPQPKTLIRRMNHCYYDQDYTLIDLSQTIQILLSALKREDLIFKLNYSSGGKGVFFLRKGTETKESLRKLLTRQHPYEAFVVQSLLKQSKFTESLNPSSVNTIRITTFLFKGKVYCLAALIRIGNPGSNVDNWCSGGSLLGIDIKTGKCNPWAMGNDKRRYTVLPSGFDLEKTDLTVPNFEVVKQLVQKQHSRIPYICQISWDIALDQDNTPTLIECNFAGMFQIHEAVTGPLFGDRTKEICDELLLKQFYLKFVSRGFLCREYHDHVVIEQYLGIRKQEKVTIPKTLRGKPVTHVQTNAFHESAFSDRLRNFIRRHHFLYVIAKRFQILLINRRSK